MRNGGGAEGGNVECIDLLTAGKLELFNWSATV